MTPTIVQIIPKLDTGGAELATLEMTEAVGRAGGKMIVLSEGGRLAEDIRAAGGEVVSFPAATKNPLRIIYNSAALADFIKSRNCHLIHARSRAPAWSAYLAARRCRIPFVTTYHGAYSEKGGLKNRYNAVMANGDRVIANSKFTAGLIRGRYGIAPDNIRIIHRGVDVERFDTAPVDDQAVNALRRRVTALQRAWGISPGQPVIMQAARLSRWKGHRFLIEAVAILQRDAPEILKDAVVIMAGESQGREGYVESLRAMIAERGLTGKIRLTGHCSDMPAAFATARVAVVASDGRTAEAFGRAAAEAQAAGCPVIAADFGAPPEIIKSSPATPAGDITGWLIPPAAAEPLAECLVEALRLAPDERRAMGRRARQHIVENFTTRRLQQQTLAVYDELLGTSLRNAFDQKILAS